MAIKYYAYIEAVFTTTRTAPCAIWCDLESERPTSGLIPGDRLYCKDTQKFYRAINAAQWLDIGGSAETASWGNIFGTIDSQVDLKNKLDAKAAAAHGHAESDVANLTTDLAGKASTVHSHGESDVTNLVTDLAGKAAMVHAHAQSDVTGLATALAGKEPANSNIQAHIASAHAPSNAQKNSDITKTEIEEKLIGEITTHTHPGGSGGLTHGQVMSRIFIGG